MGRQGLGLSAGGLRVVPVDTLPSDASTYGPLVLYQRYPTLEALPATVVNGYRVVVGGVEYLGVGGVWTAQSSITQGVWQANGGGWNPIIGVDNEWLVMPIKAQGTGAEVATLKLTSEQNCTAFIDGVGKFYTDAAGTLGQSTSVALVANVEKTIYIRMASGTGKIIVSCGNAITLFNNFAASTNSPTLDKFNTWYTRNANSIYFSGNLIALTGTTYPWVNAIGSIYFNGNLIAITHPTSLTTGTKYNRWYFRPSVGSMPSADVDRLLIDLAATWTTPTGASPTFDARGNCGARTAASDAAVATLTGRGITVLTN